MLFDVMMNSIGSSDNPNVRVYNDSSVLKPKGGVYDFVSDTDGNNATLNGSSISGGPVGDGSFKYAGTSGDWQA